MIKINQTKSSKTILKGCLKCGDTLNEHCRDCVFYYKTTYNKKVLVSDIKCLKCCEYKGYHPPDFCRDKKCFLCAEGCQKCAIYHHRPDMLTGKNLEICPHVAIYYSKKDEYEKAENLNTQVKVARNWITYNDEYKIITDENNIVKTIIIGDYIYDFYDQEGILYLARYYVKLMDGNYGYWARGFSAEALRIKDRLSKVKIPQNLEINYRSEKIYSTTLNGLMIELIKHSQDKNLRNFKWIVSDDKTKINFEFPWG